MPRRAHTSVVVLTIAGSDSGGGAGMQADLRTFQALGVRGASAIACVTAQNPEGVRGIQTVSPAMVALQIRTVCDGLRVAAAKTGMLYSSAVIAAVARTVARSRIPLLVVDPVMRATSGARLLRADAVRVLCERLLPLAALITPNLAEAEALWGRKIASLDAMREAARALALRFDTACVIKGGHLTGRQAVDVLYDRGRMYCFAVPRVRVRRTHGTGCLFSAAVTAWLARGVAVPEAVRRAQRFVRNALRRRDILHPQTL